MVRISEPNTLEDAVDLLSREPGDARVVGGGTALTILIREGLVTPTTLVSLRRIDGLDRIDVDEQRGLVALGPLVTHRAIERSEELRGRVPLLFDAFRLVGNIRVRSVATVGGVVAEADYASDPPGALIALGATVRVAGAGGERRISLQDFYRGFFATDLREDELVCGVEVPLPARGTGAAYAKYVTRSSEDRPCLGASAVVRLDADRRIESLRIVVGGATDVPLLKPELEREARGRELTPELQRELGESYAADARTISDSRGSAAYRKRMIAVWVPRVLELARRRSAAASGASG
jgi:carbon-monoxide dehydrogenase medium subunit